ncbi:MAG: hypothetical protein KC933_31070 [Myxococcales bacterium]|nr:hypothetical protein [Myxococcales bacterium]MCB9651761.1 hypothetical protein [Deltaproteobacteria bacterium]
MRGFRGYLAIFGAAALALTACREDPAVPENPTEPQAVVLTVAEAPTWVHAGAEVVVRDEHDVVLLRGALEAPPPVLVDVTAPPGVQRLTVALHMDGHDARGEAPVQEGYATCKLR